MAGPGLSHRLADALGGRAVDLDERRRVVDAAALAEAWADLPADVRELVEDIETRPGWLGTARGSVRASSASIDEYDDDEPGQFDVEVAAIVAALADFCGEVYAKAGPDFDLKHPRGAGGLFRTVFGRIQRALADWENGDSPSNANPFEGLGLKREHLRDAARRRGVTLRRGATESDIVEALKADVRGKRAGVKDAKPEVGKPVRFTLTGGAAPSTKAARDLKVGDLVPSLDVADDDPRVVTHVSKAQAGDVIVHYKDPRPNVGRTGSIRLPGDMEVPLAGGSAGDSKLRDVDVGVYTEGDKVALWEVSDSGERRKRVALVDDLAGLAAWADEHGESELAGWARKERGAGKPERYRGDPGAPWPPRAAVSSSPQGGKVAGLPPVQVHVDASSGSDVGRWRATHVEGFSGSQSALLTAVTDRVRTSGRLAIGRLRTPDAPLHDQSIDELLGRVPIDAAKAAKAAATADRHIAALDKAMEQSPLPSEAILWRGIRPTDIGLPDGDATGFEWTDAAYVGTAGKREIAENSFAQGALLRISAPSGTRAIGIQGGGEHEVLLDRGQRFRVVAERRTPSGGRELDVEIVPRKERGGAEAPKVPDAPAKKAPLKPGDMVPEGEVSLPDDDPASLPKVPISRLQAGDIAVWQPPGEAPVYGRVVDLGPRKKFVDWEGGRREPLAQAKSGGNVTFHREGVPAPADDDKLFDPSVHVPREAKIQSAADAIQGMGSESDILAHLHEVNLSRPELDALGQRLGIDVSGAKDERGKAARIAKGLAGGKVPAKRAPAAKKATPRATKAEKAAQTKAAQSVIIADAIDEGLREADRLSGQAADMFNSKRLGTRGSPRDAFEDLRDRARAGEADFGELQLLIDHLMTQWQGSPLDPDTGLYTNPFTPSNTGPDWQERLQSMARMRAVFTGISERARAPRPGSTVPHAGTTPDVTFGFSANGLTASLDRPATPEADGVIRAEGQIRDSSGSIVGSFRYHLNPAAHTAHIDAVALGVDQRGHGFTSRFVDHVEQRLREQGYTRFTVDAAYGGGVFWARRGYSWDPDRFDAYGDVPARMAQRLAGDPDGPDAAQLRRWLDQFSSDDRSTWPTPRDIADSGSLGEDVMDGATWRGSKADKKAAKAAPAAAPDLDSLRTLDTEARRDALDLLLVGSVDEPGTLKALLRKAGLPVSGKKRDLVDRLVSHLDGPVGSAGQPVAPKAPSAGTAAPKATMGVAGLPRSTGTPSVEADAPATNPLFGTTVDGQVYRAQGKAGERWTPDLGPLPSGAYEENCTNAVAAFEMRMRGYDVEAAPLDVLDKHGYAAGRTFGEIDKLLADSWSLPGGKPHGRSFSGQSWRSFDEIDQEVRAWPEGGRGYIFVGKHIFSVVKIDGKARYIEPQYDATDDRDATSLYKKRFGSVSFGGRAEEAKLVRIDDLEPTDAILQSVRGR